MANYLPISDFPGYRVGDDGTVWSCLKRLGRGVKGPRPPTGEWRKLNPTMAGKRKCLYATVALYRPGKVQTIPVHLLVLRAFKGPCPPGKEALHVDDNGGNPALSNLSWGTRRQNAADRSARGRQVRGEASPHSKLKESEVRQIKFGTFAYGELKKFYMSLGISKSVVKSIRSGRAWKHVKEQEDGCTDSPGSADKVSVIPL